MKMRKFIKKLTTKQYYTNIFRKNKSEIAQLYEILVDQKSKDTLNGVIKAYRAVLRTPGYYFTKISDQECSRYHFTTKSGYRVCGTANPYFLEDIFSLDGEMVYLDGGAYIGDTIRLLIETLHEPCKYIYAFEPNDESYSNMEKNVNNCASYIRCFNVGLGNRDGSASFFKADAGSRVHKKGTEQINVIDMGKFLSELTENIPTFIKLDIEGNESEVVEAMSDFLRSNQPDLAVSVYHKLEDLWEIPLQIHRINPNYKIYLRHQSNYFTETICYATR